MSKPAYSRSAGRVNLLVPTRVLLLAILVLVTMSGAVVQGGFSPADARVADNEQAPGTVAGTVTDAAQAPVGGIWIAFLRADEMALSAQVVVDGSGSYSTELAPGSYLAYLVDPSGQFVSGFAGAPDLVNVSEGDTTAFDPVAILGTGAITGVVRDELSRDVLEGVWAIALGADGAPVLGAPTDSTGHFALEGLQPGTYWVAYLHPAASHRSEFFPDAPSPVEATPITVSAGQEATADVSLAGQTAAIGSEVLEGSVDDSATGAGIEGALVIALRASDFGLAGTALTDPTGSFATQLPPDSYRLAIVDTTGGYEMEWFDDHPYFDLASADGVMVPAVAEVSLAARTGRVQGRVSYDGTDAPIGGAWVLAIDATGAVRGVVSDETGDYVLAGLPPGTYRMAVVDAQGDGGLEYWNDAAAFSDAQPVDVTASVPSAVDFGLELPPIEPVLASAIGYWDANAGQLVDGSLPDLSGRGNEMVLREGFAPSYPPGLVAPDPAQGRHLFSPGWDDMYMDTPDPSVPVTGVDVAWEGDLERVLEVAAWKDTNWIVHQGSSANDTLSWGVGIIAATGQVIVRWSPDGTQIESAVSEAPFPPGARRGAVVLDPDTGDLDVYHQDIEAAPEAFSSPYTEPSWQQVDSVEGAGPVTLFDSEAPIRHSSALPQDRLGDSTGEGWFKSLYRMRVREHAAGDSVAAFDVDLVPQEPEWFIEPNLPPLFPGGDPQEASTTAFPGAVGETWSIHNYRTSSFPMLLVDRPYVLFGNHNYASMGVDDELFGLTPGRDLSVWIAYSYPRVGAGGGPFVALKDWSPSATSTGWTLLSSPYLGGPSAVVSDGASVAYDPAPMASDGHINLSGLQVDADAQTIQSVTNGTTSGSPVSYSALGSLFTPGLELTVAGYSDNAVQGPSFALASLVVFDRTLTPEEISRLSTELGLAES